MKIEFLLLLELVLQTFEASVPVNEVIEESGNLWEIFKVRQNLEKHV